MSLPPFSPSRRPRLAPCRSVPCLELSFAVSTALGCLAAPCLAAPSSPELDAAAARARVALESPELRSLRLVEQELFGSSPEPRLPRDERGGLFGTPDAFSSDVPERRSQRALPADDLAFLRNLRLPQIPVRWDGRVIDYLLFFKNSPRGRELVTAWLKRRERYGDMIRRVLAEHSLPRDLEYVAMIESGYDPVARSRANARGLWQFVQSSGRFYGLRVDRWADERLDPEAATHAAARFLGELHDSLKSWELAFAAYNMGYGGLVRTLRKYNTNDYWLLANLEAGLPFETSLYVAKITAMAVVGNNPEQFGVGLLEAETPLSLTRIEVTPGTPLKPVARAAQLPLETLKALNAHILKGRVPPGGQPVHLYLPSELYEGFAKRWISKQQPAQHVSHRLRFGETLESVARRHRVSPGELREINELSAGASVGPGSTLLVPARRRAEQRSEDAAPAAAVPARSFRYPDRQRVFYRVRELDSLSSIARFFEVSEDEITTWNHLDEGATLPSDLLLQLFVRSDLDLSQTVVMTPDEVQVLEVGSDAFFAFHESQRGRVRVRYRVQAGDTMAKLAKRFELSQGSIARINKFPASKTLELDDWIILYVPEERIPTLQQRGVIDGLDAAPEDAAPNPAPSVGPDPRQQGSL